MPSTSYSLVNYLRAVSGAWRNDPRDDAELLARFADNGDEVAFQVLVCRHGLVVWQSCKRVLGEGPEAEDAFQTTFLALSRKAAGLKREPLAGWLYRVARRTALKADIASRRRQDAEHHKRSTTQPNAANVDQSELYAALDQELASLPERLRVPLLLHYLEGKSQVEVARILVCGRSVLQRRLAKAEAMLRERLEQRGLTLGTLSVAALLGNTGTSPAVPANLITSTARAAVAFRAGALTGVTANAAQKLLRSLAIDGVKRTTWWLMMVCVGCLGIGGGGLLIWKMCGESSDKVPPTGPKPEESKVVAKSHSKGMDLYGDPLPEGAIARIGTVRFRGSSSNNIVRILNFKLRKATALSPSGKVLAMSCPDGSIYFWDVATGKQLHKTVLSTKRALDWRLPYPIAYSSDDKLLAVACASEKNGKDEVKLLDTDTGWFIEKPLPEELNGFPEQTSGDKLITIGKDNIVCIRDAKTGKTRHIGPLNEEPTLIKLLPDGKTLLAAGPGQIEFWNVTTGQSARPALTCKGLLNPAILSPDGTKLIDRVGSAVSIWDVTSGKEIGPAVSSTRSPMTFIVFSPDSTALATDAEWTNWTKEGCSGPCQESGGASFRFWETTTGKSLGSLAVPSNTVICDWHRIAWPSLDTFIAQGSEEDPMRLSLSVMFKWTKMALDKNSTEADVYPGAINLSPDGRILVRGVVNKDSELLAAELLDVASGKKLATTTDGSEAAIVFSTDTRIFATQPSCKSITLWKTDSGHKLYSVTLPDPSPNPDKWRYSPMEELIMLSPDGRLLVTQNVNHSDRNTSGTHAFTLWEHVSGRVRLHLPMPPDCRDANIAFSPDSRLLAIAYGSGQKAERPIHIWDLATGQECQHFQGHLSNMEEAPKLAFSPNGKRLASSGMDYTVLIWDVHQPPALKEPDKPLDPKELHALKIAFANADAEVAYHAMCKLAQFPEQAVPLVAESFELQASDIVPKQVIQEMNRLLDDLDSDDFQTRTKAAEILGKKLREDVNKSFVQMTLLQALEKKLSVEVSKTITQLLNGMKKEQRWEGAKSPELTRMVRGIEILERINNGPARELLAKIVIAPPRPEVRTEAESALRRLAARYRSPNKQVSVSNP